MDLLAHIRTFIDIADHRSLAAAARAKSVAPSAITAALQRLEDHVGGKLIIRSTRRLSLTPEGERFLTQCRALVGDLNEAIEQVGESGTLRGLIRITSINDFGRGKLAGLVDAFLNHHPGVRIELSLGDEVIDMNDGSFDLAIRTGPLTDSRLTAKLIRRSGRSVCASPTYWETHGKPQHPEDLKDHNCLVLSRRGDPQSIWRFTDGGEQIAVHVSGNRTANDGGLLRQWAISGAGVVLKSDYDVAEDIDAGRLSPALDIYRPTDVNLYAVHASGRQPSRRVKALIEYLTNSLQADGRS